MKTILLGFLIAIIFISFMAIGPYYVVNGFTPLKPLLAKETVEGNNCYVKVNKHLTIHYERGNPHEWTDTNEYAKNVLYLDKNVLYLDGIKTKHYSYVVLCENKFNMVEQTIRSYYEYRSWTHHKSKPSKKSYYQINCK